MTLHNILYLRDAQMIKTASGTTGEKYAGLSGEDFGTSKMAE